MTNQTVTPLEEVLIQLETALDTPMVGGELPDWCKAAVTWCKDLVTELDRTIRKNHAPRFEQIFAEDPELARRVEQMKKVDTELANQASDLQQQLSGLCSAAAALEPDEARVAERVEQTVQFGLQLITAIRRQEVTLTTWHAEALNRDRGVVD
jgi:hypothetical protein